MRFWPPGSLKAFRLPFSIHRRTVTLLTPQCLATAPVVRYTGYVSSLIAKAVPPYEAVGRCSRCVEYYHIYRFGISEVNGVFHMVNPVNECTGITLSPGANRPVTKYEGIY